MYGLLPKFAGVCPKTLEGLTPKAGEPPNVGALPNAGNPEPVLLKIPIQLQIYKYYAF